MKIIIGAGNTSQIGWTALQRNDLDIRQRVDWQKMFRPNSLNAVLSEHVLEHLTEPEAEAAARNIYEFLKPGGYWRIAVPDAYNPNVNYQKWNAPNEYGQNLMQMFVYAPDEPTHKVFYNLDTLSDLLIKNGFQIKPLEYYDRGGRFHKFYWRKSDGEIYRSFRSDYLNQLRLFFNFDNTSLIVDTVK
jgi:predicted SAM-dependent methyltransferase